MLACTPMMRRFVIGWLATRGKHPARVARAAGYSDVKDGAKVRAFEVLHNPKVLAALSEEADRRLDGAGILAVLQLEGLLNSEDERIRLKAVDSALDRTGRGRSTTQDIRVEHVDSRSTGELLDFVRKLTAPMKALPVLEGEVVGVTQKG